MEGVLDVWDLNFSLKHPLIKVKNNVKCTVCPRCLDPFRIVSYFQRYYKTYI